MGCHRAARWGCTNVVRGEVGLSKGRPDVGAVDAGPVDVGLDENGPGLVLGLAPPDGGCVGPRTRGRMGENHSWPTTSGAMSDRGCGDTGCDRWTTGASMKLVIVSNRLPVSLAEKGGRLEFAQSPGGLASGLRTYLDSPRSAVGAGFTWVGWPGRAVAPDQQDEVMRRCRESFSARPVFLAAEDTEAFYEGYCNQTLWPLFHYFPALVSFDEGPWAIYELINKVFCDAVLEEAGPEDIVWVHDYHLDYSKGIANRLLAYRTFLEANPQWRGRVVLLMVVVPSRTGVEDYQRMKSRIDELVGEVNGTFGSLSWTPVLYQYKSFRQEELLPLYGVSDVMLVTPLRDGMNLIAKEYVAARRRTGGAGPQRDDRRRRRTGRGSPGQPQ